MRMEGAGGEEQTQIGGRIAFVCIIWILISIDMMDDAFVVTG